MRIATWNLNTWINRKEGISNDQLWHWAEDNLGADIVIFTEAATPPPASIAQHGWTAVHRRGGIPNRSGWGTVIAARNMRIEHVTHVGKNNKYEMDTFFHGC
jgi:exonuclease III